MCAHQRTHAHTHTQRWTPAASSSCFPRVFPETPWIQRQTCEIHPRGHLNDSQSCLRGVCAARSQALASLTLVKATKRLTSACGPVRIGSVEPQYVSKNWISSAKRLLVGCTIRQDGDQQPLVGSLLRARVTFLTGDMYSVCAQKAHTFPMSRLRVSGAFTLAFTDTSHRHTLTLSPPHPGEGIDNQKATHTSLITTRETPTHSYHALSQSRKLIAKLLAGGCSRRRPAAPLPPIYRDREVLFDLRGPRSH